MFVDAFSSVKNLSYDNFENIPGPLLKKAGEIQGIRLPALFRGSNVDQLFEGVDLLKNPVKSQLPLIEIQNTVWRRILASLPHLRKTKGTLSSVKSVFRSAGIEPDNIMLVREYGGSLERRIDKIRETKKDRINLLLFSGSNSTEAQLLDAQGRPNKKPTLKSGYLTASRVEEGLPHIKKILASGSVTFVSNTASDYNGGVVTLTSTKDKKINYSFDHNAGITTGDVVTVGGITYTKVGINGLGTKAAIANQFKNAVIHENGHKGQIDVNLNAAVANLTQSFADGFVKSGANSTITRITLTDSELTLSGFNGGFGFEKEGNSFYHGISTSPRDGLLTTSSFTFEGQYKWDFKDTHFQTENTIMVLKN
jgi:hypothetical protein